MSLKCRGSAGESIERDEGITTIIERDISTAGEGHESTMDRSKSSCNLPLQLGDKLSRNRRTAATTSRGNHWLNCQGELAIPQGSRLEVSNSSKQV